MLGIIMLYLIYCAIVYGIGYFSIYGVPLLCKWADALAEGLFIALGYLLTRSAGLAYKVIRFAASGVWMSIVFLAFLAQEAIRGPCPEESEADEEVAAAEPAQAEAYERALSQLGLSPGFDQATFNRAYKQAIRKAHPDLGGSTQEAQAVNAARGVIMRAHGWA